MRLLTRAWMSVAIAATASALHACDSAPAERTVSLKPPTAARLPSSRPDRVMLPISSIPPETLEPAAPFPDFLLPDPAGSTSPRPVPSASAPLPAPAEVPVGHVGTLAGLGAAGELLFERPWGIVVDPDGRVVFSDEGKGVVYRLTPDGQISLVAKGFNNPHGLALDRSGGIWVSDYHNHRIRRISAGGAVADVAGASDTGVTDGALAAARFKHPAAIAIAPATASGPQQVFIADSHNDRIRRLGPAGVPWPETDEAASASGEAEAESGALEVTTLTTPTGTGGLLKPFGVAVDARGYVYVADTDHHRILRFEANAEAASPENALRVRVIAGTGSPGQIDGPGGTAQFSSPMGLAIDRTGQIYVADYYNHCIRKLSAPGAAGQTTVTTVAGTGLKGFADGPRERARFAHPTAVALDRLGNLYIADSENRRVRLLKLVDTAD